MKRFARNAARISMLAISGAIVALSAYSAKADFITQADFDSTAVVSDLNNLGPCCGFPTPFTVGIYTFTNDVGNVAYPGTEGVNDSPALGSGGDLGWIRIEIAPSAQITKFGLFVGLAGEAQHNHEAVAFFDNHNDFLGSTGVDLPGGLQFVGLENTKGLIGSVLIQDTDINSSRSSLTTLRPKVATTPRLFPAQSSGLACPALSWRAAAFSAGGGGGRRSPEHLAQSAHTSCSAPRPLDCNQ